MQIHYSRHPGLNTYIRDALDGCKDWLKSNALSSLSVILLDADKLEVEKLEIHIHFSSLCACLEPSDLQSPWDVWDEEFRASLLRIASRSPLWIPNGSFRLVAETTENRPPTAQIAAHSWIRHHLQTPLPEISPLRSHKDELVSMELLILKTDR